MNSRGIALLCDIRGRIKQLLHDELGLGARIEPGQLIVTLFDPDSMEKCVHFLTALRDESLTVDWPLSVTIEQKPTLLHFSGAKHGEDIFVVGTKSSQDADLFFDELMKINNEQVNEMRLLIKERIKNSKKTQQDSGLYEELTALNNELANTQRELTKKNMQLDHQRKKLENLNAELLHTIDELQRTREELTQSEKMASLGRLVSGFAHELNTPIGIAVGSASALQQEARKVKWLLDQEEVDVDELIATVDNIDSGFNLTLSNLERAGNLISSFKRTAVDQSSGEISCFLVTELIQDVLNTLGNYFKNTAIKIKIDCADDLKIVSLAGALEQILTNLLLNSLTHGFNAGAEAGEIQIKIWLEEQQLHLCYQDNGQGMTAENLAKLFEPFFTTNRARGGTGLGTYICYNLVTTQLKGQINCLSEPGRGVKFEINYPVALDLNSA
jgi:signal transduction histidine kinase